MLNRFKKSYHYKNFIKIRNILDSICQFQTTYTSHKGSINIFYKWKHMILIVHVFSTSCIGIETYRTDIFTKLEARLKKLEVQ